MTVPRSTDATTTTLADDPVADLELGQIGVTALLDNGRLGVTAAAEVTSRSDGWIGDVNWTAELLADDGTVLGDTQGRIEVVGPGATTWVVPSFFPDKDGPMPARMNVTLLDADRLTELRLESGPLPFGDFDVSYLGARSTFSFTDNLEYEGQFHNATEARLTHIAYTCGAYADDVLVGGGNGWVYEMPPASDAGFRVDLNRVRLDPPPGDLRCVATPANISSFEPGVVGSGLVVEAGLTYNPNGVLSQTHDTTVGVSLANPTDQAAFDVIINVDLLDADGHFVDMTHQNLPYVLPGQTWYTGVSPVAMTDTAPPATTRVRVSVDHWADPTNVEFGNLGPLDLTAFDFEVSDQRFIVDSTRQATILATVTNRSEQAVEGAWLGCALLRDGHPVGGLNTTVDPLPVGVAVSEKGYLTFTASVEHDAIGCQVYLTFASSIG